MLLRAEKVDLLTIALWLGHESTASTEIYMHADNKLKQETIDRIVPTGTPPGRYQPPDRILAFLDRLSHPQRPIGQPGHASSSASPSTRGGSASSRT